MKFETKYNIGQEAWLVYDNRLKYVSIMGISVICMSINGHYETQYTLSECGTRWEHELHETKDKLLESLVTEPI